MPITGPTSFVSTTEEFVTHWGAANTSLGAGNEVVLQGGVTVAALQDLLDDLNEKRLDLAGKLNLEETARGDLEVKKAGALLRINQFNEAVRADFGGTKWEKALPNVPSINDGFGVFTAATDDVQTLWLQLNAGIAPAPALTLLGGFTQANFTTDNTGLKSGFTAWRAAAKIAELTLQERNDIQAVIQPLLVLYRRKLPTKFAADHSLVDTLPVLTPPPGSTPDAVTATFVWDATLGKAKITWSAPVGTNIVQIEVRFCAGPTYRTDVENVDGNISPTAPREFFTDRGLAATGDVTSFKVYVITDTGNEKGSNTLVVTRPEPVTP
jgi:hypothetical protein